MSTVGGGQAALWSRLSGSALVTVGWDHDHRAARVQHDAMAHRPEQQVGEASTPTTILPTGPPPLTGHASPPRMGSPWSPNIPERQPVVEVGTNAPRLVHHGPTTRSSSNDPGHIQWIRGEMLPGGEP